MRKRCTRQHFIEYLSYNYVEKQALLARCTWQRYVHDFSYDGFVSTYNLNGEKEYGKIEVQVKSTDNIFKYMKAGNVVYDLDKRDLESWINNRFPVIFVLYDAENDLAYYLEIVDYYKKHGLDIKKINKFVRIYIPCEHLFDSTAVDKLKQIKNDLI
ncbi:MAG TPA: DUF4365 domain-containing protein [Bacteroidetes bacterium]|nr:DUF4365 domain-containing protein [Bacteroidota bacterium]